MFETHHLIYDNRNNFTWGIDVLNFIYNISLKHFQKG